MCFQTIEQYNPRNARSETLKTTQTADYERV